ncbi:kinase-like protein [Thelephora ganbajun]|uniref:Kinase-like protein n=1 Tax=Thelephora ganbajun TaxID=370292 RepID=A0ACB6Z6W1_THEGA|nr:kinase-like protein [Thelephora ganbajun]
MTSVSPPALDLMLPVVPRHAGLDCPACLARDWRHHSYRLHQYPPRGSGEAYGTYTFLSPTSSLRSLPQSRRSLMAPPSSPALHRLHHLNASSPDFHDQLCNVLYGQEYQQCVLNLQDDDLVWIVDYLDKALNGLDPSGAASRKCLRELGSICSTNAILPTSYTLSADLLDISTDPFAWGGCGDVYRGTLNGSRVCVKRVRIYTKYGPQKFAKAFCKEAVMWKRLAHSNIIPLLGVTITPFQLISDWMPGGDLPEYIKDNSDADLIGLLSDIAKGLCYLHSCNVIHGDLKGPNILVDNSGHARVADFGFAMVTQNLDSMPSASHHNGHTPRWTAPEVLNEGPHTKEADVFSFAMVMIEVFTGAIPFSDNPSLVATLSITQGKRPSRPTHPTFTENLWKLMQRCWDHDPHSRPEVSEALQILLTPDIPTWKRLITQALPTDERISLITTIFSDDDQVKMVENLIGNDAQTFVDAIDEVLDTLTPHVRRKCLRVVYRICGHQALLPASLEIPLCYDPREYPVCRGGFADVWKTRYDGCEVAAKVLRISPRSNYERVRKRFCREVLTWKALRHPNVLPLLGVTMTQHQFVMVSEWMVKGNINEFVKEDSNADRLGLLGGVIRGLIYMHDQGVIHGNLKGANILINNSGHACLAGFSLVTVVADQSIGVSSCIAGGTIPWMSPELLDPESFGLKKCRLTKESDCYALGMVIYEILSGRAPFAPSMASVLKIVRGERPERPQGEEGTLFTDAIWGVLELCWKPQPRDRAGVKAVLLCLEGAPLPSRPSSNVDGDSEADTSNESDTIASEPVSPFTQNYHEPPVPPRGPPPNVPSSVTPRDGGLDLNRDLDDNGEGKDWSEGRRDNRGGSRSVLKLGDGYSQGGPSRNPSRMDLSKYPSRDYLAKHGQSKTNLLNAGKSSSRLDLVNAGDGTLLRQPSKKEPSKMNGHAAGNASCRYYTPRSLDVILNLLLLIPDHELPTGAKSRHQSQLDPGDTHQENQGSSSPQTHQDPQKLPPEGKNDVRPPDQRLNGYHENTQGQVVPRPPRQHGVWCRLKSYCCGWGQGPSHGEVERDNSNPHPPNAARGTYSGQTTERAPPTSPATSKVIQTFLRVDEVQQESPHGWKDHVRSSDPPTNGRHENDQEIIHKSVLGNTPNHPNWKRLIDPILPLDERVSLITAMFSDHNGLETVGQLCRDDVQAFVDAIDEMLNEDTLAPHVRRKCLRPLYRICGHQVLLPTSLAVPLCYNPTENPMCRGGFADVWKTQYHGREVAAKVLRTSQRSNYERVRKRFCREVLTWKALRHPNVLPLLGVTMTQHQFVMVSEWMVKGNINEFVKEDSNADRLGLLVGVVEGLIYMHDQGVIHGDLKGANILINHSGHACIADFSLVTVVADQSIVVSSCIEGGTIQWMSPELLYPEIFGLKKCHPTKASDCYALGMVIYEVLSGRTPFAPHKSPAVMKKVLDDERPERPQGEGGTLFTDSIWSTLVHCWKRQPCDRISANAVLLGLEGNWSLLRTSLLNVGKDAKTDANGQWDTTSINSSDDDR